MFYDPNLIFYIFLLMLGPAIVLMVAIALLAQSNRRLRSAGFHVSRKADVPVQFFGENFERDVQ